MIVTYVIGAVIGLAFGGIVGALKNRFIWGEYLRRDNEDASSGEAAALYGRILASNAVNVVTLLVDFLLRNVIPADGIAFLIGTAVALTIMYRILIKGQR